MPLINRSIASLRCCCRRTAVPGDGNDKAQSISPCHSLTDRPVSEGNLTAAVVPHDYATAAYMEELKMGMDVYGKHPTNDKGTYFRASIWSWRPIYSLTVELCSDLLDAETIEGMAWNNGVGPDDALTCLEMGLRIELWLAQNSGEYRAYVEPEAGFEYGVVSGLHEAGWNVPHPEYRASREHLVEWAKFLEHCGGFAVW